MAYDFSQDHITWFQFYPEQINRIYNRHPHLCKNDKGAAYAVRDYLQDILNKFCFSFYAEQCGTEYFVQAYSDYWKSCRIEEECFQEYIKQQNPQIHPVEPDTLSDGSRVLNLYVYLTKTQIATFEQLRKHWIWQAPGSDRDEVSAYQYALVQAENILLQSLPGESATDILLYPKELEYVDTAPGILRDAG